MIKAEQFITNGEWLTFGAQLPVSLAQFCTIFNSNDDVGLKHIINRRSEQGIDVEDFLSNLNEVITQGNLVRSQKTGNFEIWHGGKMAVVSPEFKGNRLMFLLTAFKSRKQKTNP